MCTWIFGLTELVSDIMVYIMTLWQRNCLNLKLKNCDCVVLLSSCSTMEKEQIPNWEIHKNTHCFDITVWVRDGQPACSCVRNISVVKCWETLIVPFDICTFNFLMWCCLPRSADKHICFSASYMYNLQTDETVIQSSLCEHFSYKSIFSISFGPSWTFTVNAKLYRHIHCSNRVAETLG